MGGFRREIWRFTCDGLDDGQEVTNEIRKPGVDSEPGNAAALFPSGHRETRVRSPLHRQAGQWHPCWPMTRKHG